LRAEKKQKRKKNPRKGARAENQHFQNREKKNTLTNLETVITTSPENDQEGPVVGKKRKFILPPAKKKGEKRQEKHARLREKANAISAWFGNQGQGKEQVPGKKTQKKKRGFGRKEKYMSRKIKRVRAIKKRRNARGQPP